MQTASIGEHIRHIRQDQGVSLNQLSEKSGFSKGYLSKVENGLAQAPIATLMTIAQSLDVTINQLFDGLSDNAHKGEQTAVITRRKDRELIDGSSDRGYRFERLAVDSSFRLTPYIIHLDDDDAPTRSYSHTGEEIIHMLSGSCNYRVGDQIHRLDTGDTLIFDAREEHGPIKLPNMNASYFAVFDEH